MSELRDRDPAGDERRRGLHAPALMVSEWASVHVGGSSFSTSSLDHPLGTGPGRRAFCSKITGSGGST